LPPLRSPADVEHLSAAHRQQAPENPLLHVARSEKLFSSSFLDHR
jgi:hypothetical protein